jgi:hypothetical protein
VTAQLLHRLTRATGGLLFFGMGLFGLGALLAPGLPFPPVPNVRDKLAWLEEHGDEYDTLFIGSSRTNGAIIPDLFDRLMGEAGMPCRSFNLGINGMRPPEDTFVLETALARRRKPLKLVVVECNAFNVYTENRRGTLRLAYWHDLKRSGAVFRNIFQPDVGRKHWWSRSWKTHQKEWAAFHLNLTLCLAHAANMGRGVEWLNLRLRENKVTSAGVNGRRTDGYDEHDPPDVIPEAEWKILTKDVADYLKNPAQPSYVDRESQRELQEKRRLIAAFGGKMMLFLPPLTRVEELMPDPTFGPPIPLLRFDDPRIYPALFERGNRLDSGHINASGSEIFTRMLAGQIVKSRIVERNPDQKEKRKTSYPSEIPE